MSTVVNGSVRVAGLPANVVPVLFSLAFSVALSPTIFPLSTP